ncbi:tetratricopeptide repeat protein [Methylosinus sp. Ce-a6]|uniref:tetratricopeptide repeat protein n=1 Tax=Methylosinus sp. Ce-a6 TaxID=2172005 RepID=UPI0013592181|nr:tetratricopeptide repeat protein [Methylosinus sp. Ce-a6]
MPGTVGVLANVALAGTIYLASVIGGFAKDDSWTRCRRGGFDERIAGCSEVIVSKSKEAKRNRAAAHAYRGDAYRAKGELDRAIADYGAAIAAKPNTASIFLGRGEAYLAKGEFDRAIADFDKASALDGALVSAYLDRAKAHDAKGDLDKAISDLGEAIRLEPSAAATYLDRGEAYRARGDFDRALADYDRAIERDPTRAAAFVSRAEVYRDRGDLERARSDLEAALKIDPQLERARRALDDIDALIAKRSAPAPTEAEPAAAPAPVPPTRMTADRWIVTSLGLALIGFIAWFFWLKQTKGVRTSETTGGYQEAMILVKGGYTPDTIIVTHGRPVRLNFRREETASCSDKVVFADFQKTADLPTGQTVAVELLPKEPGEFAFGCPMGMFRGRLIVE